MQAIAERTVACRTDDQRWLVETRAIVADLLRPNAAVYWIDLVATLAVGYPALVLYSQMSGVTWQRGLCYVLAVVSLFRAGSFMHELAHLGRGELRSFHWGWNLLFGVPFLMPSFFYLSHLGHHNTHYFGTREDGEYLPLASGSFGTWLEFLIQVPLMPVGIMTRFLLSPLTFLHPKLRRWVLEHASSFVINFRARRPLPRFAPTTEWAVLELACSAMIWSLLLGTILDWPMLVHLGPVLLVVFGILALNYLRTLVAHRYLSVGGEMTLLEQLGDSINIEGRTLLTELAFPVGLRYHALHHLFPSIPYHNLGIAHRRLMARLPADSPYRRSVFPSTWAAIKCLGTDFCVARKSRAQGRLDGVGIWERQ